MKRSKIDWVVNDEGYRIHVSGNKRVGLCYIDHIFYYAPPNLKPVRIENQDFGAIANKLWNDKTFLKAADDLFAGGK